MLVDTPWKTFVSCQYINKRYIAKRGRDRLVVGFTTTYAISAYHHWCWEFESRSGRGVQYYVIKFVNDLREVGGFLRVLRFPPPIKLTPRYNWNIVESGITHHQTNKQTNKQTNTQYCKTIDKKETQIAYTIPLIAVYSYLLNHGEGILIVRPQY